MKSTILSEKTVAVSLQLMSELGITSIAGQSCAVVMVENLLLLESKHRDYGPGNISKWGLLGVLVRLSDKVERLASLLGQRRRKPQNEAVVDTLRDICNYAVIAEVVRRGEWPAIEPTAPTKPLLKPPKPPKPTETVNINKL